MSSSTTSGLSTQMMDIGYIGAAELVRQMLLSKSKKVNIQKVLGVAGSDALYQYVLKAMVDPIFAGFTGEAMMSQIISEILSVGGGLYFLESAGVLSKKDIKVEGDMKKSSNFMDSLMLATYDVLISEAGQKIYDQIYNKSTTLTS